LGLEADLHNAASEHPPVELENDRHVGDEPLIAPARRGADIVLRQNRFDLTRPLVGFVNLATGDVVSSKRRTLRSD
jgi:hypothetical protein